MPKKSKFAERYQELGLPYRKKETFYRNIAKVFFLLIPLFFALIIFLREYAIYEEIGLVAVIVILSVVFSRMESEAKKAKKYLITSESIQEYIDYYELNDIEVDELDKILEEINQGIYTIKIGDTKVTFASNLIVKSINIDDIQYIEACKVSTVTEVSVNEYETEVIFNFEDNKESIFCFDYNYSDLPDGKEGFIKLIESYYPDLKFVFNG
ncbi:MAG: hypothetical protein MJ172_10910 [Clostridia bacterium]|nr:hypothetical protein [Clostridia bacterium]